MKLCRLSKLLHYFDVKLECIIRALLLSGNPHFSLPKEMMTSRGCLASRPLLPPRGLLVQEALQGCTVRSPPLPRQRHKLSDPIRLPTSEFEGLKGSFFSWLIYKTFSCRSCRLMKLCLLPHCVADTDNFRARQVSIS